jgi:DUF4097 and DUF4098 domain-containing protein YvlB
MTSRIAIGLLALVALPAGAAAQAIERPFERTLTVSGPVSLAVNTGSGSIVVTPGGDGAVRVTGVVRGTSWWRGASDADVRQAVEAVAKDPPIAQRGNDIEVGRIEDRELANRVAISYEITVPRTTSLRVGTGSGSVRAGGLAGNVAVSTGSGSVEIGATEGEVSVNTGSGSVKIGGAQRRAQVNTGSGTIHLGTLVGDARVQTGSGSIHVDRASGGTVDLATASGGVTVSRLDGDLQARTSSGSVKVDGVPKGSWDVTTTSGQITLGVPAGTAFSLAAHTSSGSIETDHALTVQSTGRRELVGSTGSGGARITARTTSGSIHVNKR